MNEQLYSFIDNKIGADEQENLFQAFTHLELELGSAKYIDSFIYSLSGDLGIFQSAMDKADKDYTVSELENIVALFTKGSIMDLLKTYSPTQVANVLDKSAKAIQKAHDANPELKISKIPDAMVEYYFTISTTKTTDSGVEVTNSTTTDGKGNTVDNTTSKDDEGNSASTTTTTTSDGTTTTTTTDTDGTTTTKTTDADGTTTTKTTDATSKVVESSTSTDNKKWLWILAALAGGGYLYTKNKKGKNGKRKR